MTESQIKASGTISGVSEAEQGGKTSPAARKRSESPLPADVATIRAAILDVIDTGDQDGQHWFFYENTDGLHNWTEDNANRDRMNFADAVVARIIQLQQPPFVEREEQV